MDRQGRRPTAEEVISKLKDDGDFDTLRLKIIRKVKENEELRNSIVSEVKQSTILNEDGSEKLKLRQLSDAIYHELGSKIMGHISDEVWRVIKSKENEIRGTVESVYERLVNPEVKKEDRTSPAKQQDCSGKEDHATNLRDAREPEEPPGFALSDRKGSNSSKPEHNGMLPDQQPRSAEQELHHTQLIDAPPGFGPSSDGARAGFGPSNDSAPPGLGPCSDDAPPPGFGPCMDGTPPGFGLHGDGAKVPGGGGGGDEDPDVPPGFG